MRFTKTVAAACLAAALVVPATASAADAVPVDTTAESILSCVDPTVSPLLADFGDLRSYFVAPGGDFEGGADGWQLSDGAAIVPGSSTLGIVGGASSLSLPAGAEAISPAFCVDERYPSFRMAYAQHGSAEAKVNVDVIDPDANGKGDSAGRFKTRSVTAWGLTPDMKLDTKQSGWHRIALRISVDKADTRSDLRIDDVVIDPRMR